MQILLQEMFRILKKGGKIIMSDGMLLRRPKDLYERRLLEKLYLGWKLKGGNTIQEIIESFTKVGFKNVKFINKTRAIKKNINTIYIRGLIAYPFLKMLRFFRLISQVELENAYAPLNQKKTYEKGLFGYGMFYAEK